MNIAIFCGTIITMWIIVAIILFKVNSFINEYKIINKYSINNNFYILVQKSHFKERSINLSVSKKNYELLNIGDKIIINLL